MDTFEFFIFKIFVVKCTLITSFEGDFENVPALFSEGYFSIKKGSEGPKLYLTFPYSL